MNLFVTALVLVSIGLVLSCTDTSNSDDLPYKIVDTGVTAFYDNNREISYVPGSGSVFNGQDATYCGNQPRYSFVDSEQKVVRDENTGLMWMRYLSPQGKMTYEQAKRTYHLVNLGGFNDWRIPNVKELFSLIKFTGSMAGGAEAGGERFIDTNYFEQPLGNTSIGEREIDAQVLSGTEYTGRVFGGQQCNFGVNFIDGRIKCYPRHGYFYVRLVRGNPNYGQNRFENNGDTVSDLNTGLMWQRNDAGPGHWPGALQYCLRLDLGGFTDWRLPNVKELQSIVDYSRGPQTTNTPAIDSIFNTTRIRLTDGSYDYPYYWSGTTHVDGRPIWAAYVAFGQGWGAPWGNSLVDVHGAGSQRSDPKIIGPGRTYPEFFGPQGDMRVVNNYARCVRNI